MAAADLETYSSLTNDPRKVDGYFRQGIPLLETCWKFLHDLTNLALHLQLRSQAMEAIILIRIAVVLEFVDMVKGEEHPFTQPDTRQGRLLRSQVPTTQESLSIIALGSEYSHKLQMVVEQEQTAVLELQSKDRSISRKLRKLTELKNSLEDLVKTVDRIMEFYTMQSLGFAPGSLPSLDDIREVKDRINGMRKTLKAGELHDLFSKYNKELDTTEENIMCNLLSMKEDFGHYLHNLDPTTRQHQTDWYFLEGFIENQENILREKGLLVQDQGKMALAKNLEMLGFSSERASAICDNVPDDIIELQSPSFWAMKFLDHVFTHHPLFSSVPRYPYKEENVDQVFTENIPVGERSDPAITDGISEWPVKIFNASSKKDSRGKIDKVLQTLKQDEQYRMFYHGTSHMSARSILTSGIIISEGKRKQDFSSGDGFYVSEVFENAESWSRATKENPQAIVVFKVPGDLVEKEENGRDLSSAGSKEDWKAIVRLCRGGYKNKKQKKQLLDQVSFIRGPMCTNPKDLEKGHPQPSGFGSREDPANIQLCVRDEDYAEKFGSIANIGCVIFY